MNTYFKRWVSGLMALVLVLSAVPVITPTAKAEDAIPTTSAKSQSGKTLTLDSTASSLQNDSAACDVLLIQSNAPWDTSSNESVLSALEQDGHHSGYHTVTIADALTEDFSDYAIIVYANDQTAESYSQHSQLRVALEAYIYNGGTVLFGACGSDLGKLSQNTELPAGVVQVLDPSTNNYIADADHPIVTGTLTDGTALTDEMLYAQYCSLTSFDESTLPAGSNVILRATSSGAPTLVEYPYGAGSVILSGLTWEFGYAYWSYWGDYGLTSFDDYLAYGLSLADIQKEGSRADNAVDFPYNVSGLSSNLAKICVQYAMLAYGDSTHNSNGTWVRGTDESALGIQLHSDRYEDLYSYNYAETKGDCVTVKEEDPGTHSILYTIGHRPVKDSKGNVTEQLIVVFRGTNDREWYGNFDLTGTSYNSSLDYHYSFQAAVDDAMKNLAAYIQEMTDSGKMYTNNIKIVLTGHSRGAAVANLMAHELSDISRNITTGSNAGYFADIDIGNVYAYTFATPNVATYSRIMGDGVYSNIYNFCFTDDLASNFPLESWSWGKYGKTYWATAAKLDDNATFHDAAVTYFGEVPSYSSTYTNRITGNLSAATHINNWSPLKHYYNYTFSLGENSYATPYQFLRGNVAGLLQEGDPDASAEAANALAAAAGGSDISNYFRELAHNLVLGFSSDYSVSAPHRNLNGPLYYAHHCGSYYQAIQLCFSDFKYSELTSTGYAATLNSAAAGINDTSVEYDADQVAAFTAFLEQTNETGTTNAAVLGWESADVSTWAGVIWASGSISEIHLSYGQLTGSLDATAYPDLAVLDVHYSGISELTVADCASLTELRCSGNDLAVLELTGLTGLTELECANNRLTALALSDCTALTSLDCSANLLADLDLSSCTNLLSLICMNNSLDPNDADLNALADSLASKTNGYAEILPQAMAADPVFSENDVAQLAAIANQNDNNAILAWDLEDPASWTQVRWVLAEGVCYAQSVNLSGLGLTGSAAFDGLTRLNHLNLDNNCFTDLSVQNCAALETLWCAYNYLDENRIAALESSLTATNVKLCNQYSDKVLHADDVAALDTLTNALDLPWESELYATNPALVWELQAEGCHILTGMDLSETDISGTLDLSEFTHLTDILCQDNPITGLILPDGLSEIGDYAFAGCAALRTVTVPESVTAIGDHAFDGCSILTLVDFLGHAPTLGENAFANCRENIALRLHFQVDQITLKYANQYTLSTEHFPSGSALTWESSMASAASVNTGVVTAEKTGAALITVVADNGFQATCEVIVPAHNLAYVDNGDGTHSLACTNCSYTEISGHDFAYDMRCVCGAKEVFLGRLSGLSRCETAYAVGYELMYRSNNYSTDSLILTSGNSFADALAGSYLAADLSAPILLHRAGFEEENLAFIQENVTAGGTIFILGGPVAVPSEMEDMLDEDYRIVRLQGGDRFQTNLEILDYVGVDASQEILITTGWEYADALSVSATGLPILMVNSITGKLTDAQVEFLESHTANSYTIIGGPVAVSEDLENTIESVLVKQTDRVYGNTREETSIAVAMRYFDSPDYICLAYSRNFPDGLCGGPLAHRIGAPLILTDAGKEDAAAKYVQENNILGGYVLGGEGVLSNDTVYAVFLGE